METVPEIEGVRNSEALLVVLDSNSQSEAAFEEIRDAAVRLARTRLIYGVSKDDLLGALISGSQNTKNALAIAAKGGYQGIEVAAPLVTRSLRAVKALQDTPFGTKSSNLLNILDVCGDLLTSAAAKRSFGHRLVIFTDGVSIVNGFAHDELRELEETCQIYKENGLQLDVICTCDKKEAEEMQRDCDTIDEMGEVPIADIFKKCATLKKPFFLAFAKATGGMLISLEEASPLVDVPVAKITRPIAKFRGVLNIADALKIPVKRFSYVSQARVMSGKKISWDASVKRSGLVPVLTETQKVSSATDDSPLEKEQIVNAYPYGPDLVPESTDVDTYAWSMHLPRGLDVLGFVPQESVPQHLFLGSVDVIVAMSGSKGACELMKSLVLAMQAEKMGMLARSVTSLRGGAPNLSFLWPRVEVDAETRSVRNCFLFLAEVAMREDVRHLPFARLSEMADQLTTEESEVMQNYIAANLLDATESDSDDEENSEAFWPPEHPNPNLDWFNICIANRALEGTSGPSFPPLATWHRKILDPKSFLSGTACEIAENTMKQISTILPIVPAMKREKKGKKVYRALTGELASIQDYLPAEENKDLADEGTGENEEDNEQNAVQIDAPEPNDNMSEMSDVDILDVGDDDPVSDFQLLVRKGRFRFAALSIHVIIRRLIRDLVDDEKALKCLQALRKTCYQQKEPRFFNDFVSSLLEKCERQDENGNRIAAFFRHVGRHGMIDSTLDAIPLTARHGGGEESNFAKDFKAALEEMSASIRKIALSNEADFSMSTVSR